MILINQYCLSRFIIFFASQMQRKSPKKQKKEISTFHQKIETTGNIVSKAKRNGVEVFTIWENRNRSLASKKQNLSSRSLASKIHSVSKAKRDVPVFIIWENRRRSLPSQKQIRPSSNCDRSNDITLPIDPSKGSSKKDSHMKLANSSEQKSFDKRKYARYGKQESINGFKTQQKLKKQEGKKRLRKQMNTQGWPYQLQHIQNQEDRLQRQQLELAKNRNTTQRQISGSTVKFSQEYFIKAIKQAVIKFNQMSQCKKIRIATQDFTGQSTSLDLNKKRKKRKPRAKFQDLIKDYEVVSHYPDQQALDKRFKTPQDAIDYLEQTQKYQAFRQTVKDSQGNHLNKIKRIQLVCSGSIIKSDGKLQKCLARATIKKDYIDNRWRIDAKHRTGHNHQIQQIQSSQINTEENQFQSSQNNNAKEQFQSSQDNIVKEQIIYEQLK